MSAKVETLYNAMLAADEAFHAAVIAQFGRKWAGTMRYHSSAFVPSTRVSGERFWKACSDYLDAVHEMRAAS